MQKPPMEAQDSVFFVLKVKLLQFIKNGKSHHSFISYLTLLSCLSTSSSNGARKNHHDNNYNQPTTASWCYHSHANCVWASTNEHDMPSLPGHCCDFDYAPCRYCDMGRLWRNCSFWVS